MIVYRYKNLKMTIFLAKIEKYDESPFMTHQKLLGSKMKVVVGDKNDMHHILKYEKFDFIFVAGFPWRIPVLGNLVSNTPSFNIHPSSLPKYWGPDPVRNQILDLVDYFGVSIHTLTKNFDAGNVIHNSNIKNNNQMCIFEILYRLGKLILPYIYHIIDKEEYYNKFYFNQKSENKLIKKYYAESVNIRNLLKKQINKDNITLVNRLLGTSKWKERLYHICSV